MRRVIGTVLVLAAMAGLPAAAQNAARGGSKAYEGISLAGHRAIYDLSMLKSDPSVGIAVRGRLAIEFKDVCDGYTLTQRLHTETTGPDGDVRDGDYSVTSWESKDGQRYRFSIRHTEDGAPPEEFVGTARNGSKGAATFTKPQGLKIDLPAGTVYPTEHLALLIRGARNGDRFVPVKVFDGSGDDGVFDVGGSIGKAVDTSALKDPLLQPLAGKAAWPVRLGYFSTMKKSEQPQYEMSFRLFENGVSDELVLDYGDYALKGTMTGFDLFPKPSC
jgi:hypothetical protein